MSRCASRGVNKNTTKRRKIAQRDVLPRSAMIKRARDKRSARAKMRGVDDACAKDAMFKPKMRDDDNARHMRGA